MRVVYHSVHRLWQCSLLRNWQNSWTRIFMRRLFTSSAVFFIASHYIIRLKNDFLIGFFQTFLISSIYTGLSNQSDFAWGWLLVPLGFGFYIFIYLMINKYITSRALVNWVRKILEKKSEKVVKLDSFGLYNILGD